MQRNLQKLFAVIALLALTSLSTGCGARYIDSPLVASDAKIEKTDTREDILFVMESYSEALGALDIEQISALVSEDYYENNGTTHTTDDDYGFSGVVSLFETLKEHVADVRVRMAIREINVQDDQADVLFDYEYTMLYRIGESERWSTERDVNRVELRNEDGVWRIISGL
jgi:hypothetical protein